MASDISFKKTAKPSGSTAPSRLLRRVESVVGPFNHALPAHALTEQAEEFFGDVQKSTVKNFKSLIELLNQTVVDKT